MFQKIDRNWHRIALVMIVLPFLTIGVVKLLGMDTTAPWIGYFGQSILGLGIGANLTLIGLKATGLN